MGSEESKAYIEHNGDSHIDIINMQSEHSEKFEENKLMLQILLAIVAKENTEKGRRTGQCRSAIVKNLFKNSLAP